ncbi:hypothetical protein BH09VER1_BH09VER1_46100 [soil metagenome]
MPSVNRSSQISLDPHFFSLCPIPPLLQILAFQDLSPLVFSVFLVGELRAPSGPPNPKFPLSPWLSPLFMVLTIP